MNGMSCSVMTAFRIDQEEIDTTSSKSAAVVKGCMQHYQNKEDVMQLKDSSPQQKLQEMCDCYLETDFAAQLAAMTGKPSADLKEDAVKYLSLALMYGLTEKARKVTLKKKGGKIRARIKAVEQKIKLPQPTADLFDGVIDLIRGILHFDSVGGSSQLVLGLRNSQLDLRVKLKELEEKTSLKFTFPELGE